MTERLLLDLDGPEATRNLGRRLGRLLQGGETMALRGDLGAGKTTFVQGLALGLGIHPDTPVTSPSFVLVVTHSGGRLTLHHVDLYRLSLEEALDLGLEEILSEPRPGEPVAAVEWAERIEELLPFDRLEINLLWSGPDRRRAELRALGPHGRTLLQKLGVAGPEKGD